MHPTLGATPRRAFRTAARESTLVAALRNRLRFRGVQMFMVGRAIACGVLLLAPCAYGQENPLERHAFDFISRGVGLTETLLKFSHQQHVPIAIEYVDRASMEQPIEADLHGKTVQQTLDSILRNGHGYSWRLRDGIVEITNSRASKRAENQFNKVIPVFEISQGATVKLASALLWWNLQTTLDPNLKEKGLAGHIMGMSSTIKPTTLHNRTVREILSYIVLNSQAQGWTVSGPPECLGFTPYCGLWFMIEWEPSDPSYKLLLQGIRNNL